METKIRTELEKAVMDGDILGFRDELIKKLSSKIMMFSSEDLLALFRSAAEKSDIDWNLLTEPIYDDGIDYSSRTRRFKSQVIDSFVNEIIGFIMKRRGSLRFDLKKEVDVFSVGSMVTKPFNARLENISDNGMLIRSSTPFKMGEELDIRVYAKETVEPVRVFGSVVRTENKMASIFDIGLYTSQIIEHDGIAVYSTAEELYRLSQMRHE